MTIRRAPAGTAAKVALLAAAAVLTLVGVLGGQALPSTALLTSSRSTSAATVATANVTLSLSNGAATGTWLGAVAMVPGSTKYARLTVTNGGSVSIRYSATALSSSALSSALVTNVAVLASGTTSCAAATFSAGTLVSGANLPFGATPAVNLIGDPATGAQTGDRTLAAAAAEDLCLKLDLPLGTGLGYAGRGATAATTITFSAENA